MNTTAAVLIASAAKAAIAYIRNDQTRKYGLLRRTVVFIDGPGVGKFHYKDDVLTIISPTSDCTILVAEPFKSESNNWNGPDVLPDTRKDGSFEMSLWHDLIVGRAKEIAKENHTREQRVFKWANDLVPALMELYAEKKPKGWWKRLVHSTLEIARPFYHPFKKLVKPFFGCLAIAVACGFSGCDSPPDWHAHGGDDAAIVWELDGTVRTNFAHGTDGWYGEEKPDWFVQAGIAAPGLQSRAPIEFVTNYEERGWLR